MRGVARWLLRAYPRPWRHRYEAELAALLDDHDSTVATVFDLLIGAIDARLDPAFHRTGGLLQVDQLQSLRLASRAAYWAVVFFFASYFFVVLDRLDGGWDAVRGTPSLAATAYTLANVSAGIILVTLFVTLLIVELARMRGARGTWSKLCHAAAAIGPLAISFGASQVHDWLLHGMPWDQWLFLVSLGGVVAIPITLGLVIGKPDLSDFETRVGWVGAIVVGLAMVIDFLGLVVVQTITSGASPNGSWSAQMVGAFVLLLIPTSVTVGALVAGRGPRGASRLSAAP